MPKTVTFDDLTNPAVTVQAPRYPEEPGRHYPQVVTKTAGGSHVVADLGDGSSIHETAILHFRTFPNADMTSLLTFLETTVQHSKTLFTFTDPFGTDHTSMRYLGGIRERRRTKGNFWDFDLEIEKDQDP